MRILSGAAAIAIAASIGLAGQAEAQASPRDTARAVVAGATLIVDYGRPSKRGREIFGGLVPYDRVWRTGANQATHLVTDKPLMFGSTMVPAGTYTLYTLPTAEGWHLIINRQTGQWGTTYDESQDHARVAMRVASLPEVVEQFTIKIESASGGGVLRLEWDKTVASIPFMVH